MEYTCRRRRPASLVGAGTNRRNIPIALIALAATPALMPAARARRGSVDVAGALTVTAGLAAAVYAIVRAPGVGRDTAETWLVLAGAAALLAIFMGSRRAAMSR